jgi:hypothetical protein
MSDDDSDQHLIPKGFRGIFGKSYMNLFLPEMKMPEPVGLLAVPTRLEETFKIPDFEFDDSPQRTAENTAAMNKHMGDLLRATHDSLRLAEASRADSARVERFTRRISWASLWISIGSLTVAVASLGVALIAIANG